MSKRIDIKITRRHAMWAGAAAATLSAAALMRYYMLGGEHQADTRYDRRRDGGTPVSPGYGRDPNLTAPRRDHWTRLLTDVQKQTAGALADTILPGDAEHPAPTALGIVDFLDEWVSAPYPDQEADRELLTPLLDRLASQAFAQRPHAVQARGVQQLHARGGRELAFGRFALLVASAYYATPEGAALLGYVGNEPQTSFEGPPQAVLDILTARFRALG